MKISTILGRLPLGVAARDSVGIAGAGLVAHGAAQIYAPAGWIVAGVLMLAAAILLARRG